MSRSSNPSAEALARIERRSAEPHIGTLGKYLEGLCVYEVRGGFCKMKLDSEGRCRLHGIVEGGPG